MIPHEKIEQAAYDYSFTQRSEYDSKSILERKDIKLYYKDGVRFAEAELKSVAMEFAEWLNNYQWVPSSLSVWTKYSAGMPIDVSTTSELSAKLTYSTCYRPFCYLESI